MYRACLESTPGESTGRRLRPGGRRFTGLWQPNRTSSLPTWCCREPTEDAVDLIRCLRRDFRTHHIAIVVITGWSRPADDERAMDAGCDLFLEKPCQPEILRIEIRRAAAVARRRTFNRTTDLGHATATGHVIASLDRPVFSANLSKAERKSFTPKTPMSRSDGRIPRSYPGKRFPVRLDRTQRRAAPYRGEPGKQMAKVRNRTPSSLSHEWTKKSPGDWRQRNLRSPRRRRHGKALKESSLQAEREIDEAMERTRT